MVWTKGQLQGLVRDRLEGFLFLVVSNRQPYVHVLRKGKIVQQRGAGGVITAIDPVMRACGGTWVAYGNGDADARVADEHGRVGVPGDNPAYTLRRVWLSKEEVNGYYYGFSNEALWPLCHTAFQRPVFRQEDWDCYRRVNRRFAEAVAEEVGDRRAFVWIQDYHLTLLPGFLKEMLGTRVITAHFWHIPWPNYEAFRICPQKKQILAGLLANDLLGFHLPGHCTNFVDAVEHELESRTDAERSSIWHREHESFIRPYPISVDFAGIGELARSAEVEAAMTSLKEEFSLEGLRLLAGVDRIDYTKGIPERIHAIDRLFEKHPELREKVVFLQIGEISRIHIPGYKDINDRINALVEQVNWKHSTSSWKPVVLVRRHLDFTELLALYRLCDECIVSSLHDGMNLVAKEFVASRVDNGGVLVLSEFTGAARELTDAQIVNPYDREQFSDALFRALNMPPQERCRRMSRLRETVGHYNIYRWAGKIISELLKFEFQE